VRFIRWAVWVVAYVASCGALIAVRDDSLFVAVLMIFLVVASGLRLMTSHGLSWWKRGLP
jgi:hypothetical protein